MLLQVDEHAFCVHLLSSTVGKLGAGLEYCQATFIVHLLFLFLLSLIFFNLWSVIYIHMTRAEMNL